MLLAMRRRLKRLLPLLAATLVVGIGAYFVGMSAINDMERSRAEYVAKSFAHYLAQEVPDITGIIHGNVTAAAASEMLGPIKPIGTVFKFRLYDEFGNLRVDSSPFAAGHLVNPLDSFQDQGALSVSERGQSNFSFRQGDGRVLPGYYSEILMPLFDGTRLVGVLSVISDETQDWPELQSEFRSVTGQALLLILVAFGVPLILYVRNLGQLDFTRRRLRHSAQHDELTGVLNRTGFARALGEQLAATGQRGMSIAVHIVDLDRFKDVNDSGGHGTGDAVLQQATARIESLLGGQDRLARLGADEFAVLQPFFPTLPSAVGELGTGIARAMAMPFVIDGTAIQIGGSVGYAVHPRDGAGAADLMRAAEVALHHAKQHARGHAIPFSPSMEAERRARHNIEGRLRAALQDGDLELHYQPVFETSGGRLRGFEALLRLADEAGQPISPADFVPVAEEIGLINEIGVWVLGEACRTATQWPQDLFVAVNLSPAQFAAAGMAGHVEEALRRSGLAPSRLELEVTESVLITDTEKVLRELRAIKALGPTLALDDFGTGYSSLSYLWRFPFDKLKVDRSFMADLTVAGSKSREILATIIALGRVLNLTITAEGVETEAQAAVLAELDCDLVQGFLFGRPQRSVGVAATILKAVGSLVATELRPVLSDPARKGRGAA